MRSVVAVIVSAFVLSSCSSALRSSQPQTTKTDSSYSGHGATSVSAETLQKFAAPPLDPNIARKIQAMLDVRSPGMGLPSPDGQKLFFTWSITGTQQLWRLDSPKAFPVQLTGGTDRTWPSAITPDGKWLIVSRDRAGEENPGIYLQRPDGGALIEIFHKPGVRTSVDWISEDSRTLYYAANDIKADSMSIYAHDIGSGKRTLVWGEPGLWSLADIRKDGLMLLSKWTGALSSEWYTFEPKTKSLKALLGQNEAEEYEVKFGTANNEYIVLTNRLGNFRRLYRFANGKLKPLTPEKPMDVESFAIDDQRKRILVNWNDQGYSRLEAYDAKTFAPIALPNFPSAASVYSGATTMNARFSTIGVESGKAPRTSYVYDWQTKKLTQWVIPSAPEVNLAQFAEVRLEFYPARDGTKIPMLVRRPKNCKAPCPVIVNFHGGPESQTRPGFDTRAQMFVDAGFVFVEPNVRGSDGYGKAWLKSDDGPKRLKVITDIEDAAIFIRKNWSENGREPKVGVMGGSYGGYSTLYAMTKFAGAYDAGVANVGMSNLMTFLMNTAPYRRILRITEYGDPEKDREALIELSPMTHLQRVRAPVLIIQGASDPRVPVGEAVQMYQAMKKKGLDSQLIIFADEGHGSAKRENQVLQFGHTIAFFKRTLTDQPVIHSNH